MPSRDTNLASTGGRWSFALDGGIRRSKTLLSPGDELILSARVRNDGLEIGTAYVRVLIADSLSLQDLRFDSHRNLSARARLTLRLVDIPVGETKDVACAWAVPRGTADGHFEVRFEVWNPHLLYKGPEPRLFSDSGWIGGFFVVGEALRGRDKVFISYSWDGADHEGWVRELAEELGKYDIECILDKDQAFGGDEISHFIEQGLKRSTAVLLICSENYTKKANSRKSGGVGFETVLYSHEYMACTPRQRARFIPVVRNNGLRGKIPRYLGSVKYIDMSAGEWRSAPMLKLVQAIKRQSRTRKT